MTLQLARTRYFRTVIWTTSLALVVSATWGCNARLGVSELPVGAGGSVDGGSMPAGSGGDSGAATLPEDAGTRTPPSCADDSRNGTEIDINCGGQDCAPCAADFRCERHTDCASGLCRAGLCAAPACDDGVQNGDETGLDCGGSCLRCRMSTCNCAISATLSAMNCDESEGYLGDSYVVFITPDGQTALYSERFEVPGGSSGERTFRWTATSGLELIGNGYPVGLSNDGEHALYQSSDGGLLFDGGMGADLTVPLDWASILSADGSQVIGPAGNGSDELLRWTPDAGVELIAALPAGESWRVTALTPDASAAVGWGSDAAGSDEVPFYWTASGGISTLGALPENVTGARPLALSDDGTIIVGATTQAHVARELFRWTQGDGFSILGQAGTYPFGGGPLALFISADGAAIAGSFGGEVGTGFRWTAGGATEVFTSDWSKVTDMNRDGSIVLAAGSTSGFIWTETAVTTFSDVLAERGVDLAGWFVGEPHKMTNDGSVVFGSGSCGGVPVTYRLVLNP